ncbi:MAG: hypothetical protein K8U03_14750 [Planctomycetia bacterium]|nr:hypothetical protein [Planctomycetia bacterium]
MEPKLATLVENLVHVKGLSEGFEKLAEAKLSAVNEINESLTDEVKETLRIGMDFKLVKQGRIFDSKKKSIDKRGQEYAVDVVGSIKGGYRLRGTKEKTKKITTDGVERKRSEYGALHEAMGMIIEITGKALAKKLPTGEPVYDPRPIVRNGKSIETEAEARKRVNDEIERDIFTPLVREGLLPETFVLDEYSEVAKLIKNSLKSYKATTQRKKEETEEKFAKLNFNAAGGGKKGTDSLSGVGGQLGRMINQRLGDNAQDIKRGIKVGVDFAKMLKQGAGGYSSVKSVAKGKALERAKDFLDPKRPEALKKLSPLRREELGLTGKNPKPLSEIDTDMIRTQLDQQYRENRYNLLFDNDVSVVEKTPSLDDDKAKKLKIVKIFEAFDSDPVFYTKMGFDTLKDYTECTVGIIKEAGETHKAYTEKVFSKRGGMTVAAQRVAEFIDLRLPAAVVEKTGNEALGEAFEGAYTELFDVDEMMEVLVDEFKDDLAGKVDLSKLVAVYADVFKKVFAKVSPKLKTEGKKKEGNEEKPKIDLAAALQATGEVLAKKFTDVANQGMVGNKKEMQKNLEEKPELAFRPLADAAAECLGVEWPKEFIEAGKDNETVQKMLSASLDLGDEAQLDELMRSEEEAKEFQKALVLVDKGAMSVKTLEAMIQQLKQDKQLFDLIGSIGKTLFTAPGTPVQIVGRATEKLTAEVTGEIMMALKAAKLIMELVINIKKAIDRRTLFNKFKQDTERSRIAVSSLTSTIQGFFNNKKEQVTLNTINDVLMFVQAAGNIVGSVPTPYTLVIGKTIDKVAGALRQTNKVAGELYNERMLSKGWTATKKAINDPTNRAQGLKALRLNPTLGMHSIAWAAMEKTPPDPVARMFLADLGVTEQTLAASGTEQKILEYLQTLLDEDRSLIDFYKINSKWAPDNPQLTIKDWFITVSRAQSDAEPPLAKGGDEQIMNALKAIAGRKLDLNELTKKADKGEIELMLMEELIGEAEELCAALDDYEPVSALDSQTHDEMLLVAGGFLKKAGEFRDTVLAIANTNTRQALELDEAVVKALNGLNGKIGEILKYPKEEVAKRFAVKKMIQLQNTAKKTIEEVGATRELEKNENSEVLKPLATCKENVRNLSAVIIYCEPRLALDVIEEQQDKLDQCEEIRIDLLMDPGIQKEVAKLCDEAGDMIKKISETGTTDKVVIQRSAELKETIERIKKTLENVKQPVKN